MEWNGECRVRLVLWRIDLVLSLGCVVNAGLTIRRAKDALISSWLSINVIF